jgi:Protein of unknown function (DUF1257)
MSHLLDFKTQVTDKNALVRALERMGFKGKVEVFDKAQILNGYHREDNKRGHIIVRKQNTGIPADIGFEQAEDGTYVAHIDEFHYASAPHYNKAWQDKLYTYYNVEKSKMELEAKGISYDENRDDNGRIVIKATFKPQTNTANKVVAHL